MADRTSAELFGEIFKLLADDAPLDREALKLKFWRMGGNYDFLPYQMYCDDALRKLDLMRTDEDGYDVYHGDSGFDLARRNE